MLSEDARVENEIIKTLEYSTLRKRSLKNLVGELLLSQPKGGTHNSVLIYSESLTDSGIQLFRSYYDFARHNVRPQQFEKVASLLPGSDLDEIVDTYYYSYKNPQLIPRDLALHVKAAKTKTRELKLDARVSKLLYQKSNTAMLYSACLIVYKLREKQDQMAILAGRQLIEQLYQLPNFPDFLLRVAVDEALDGDVSEMRERVLEILPSALFPPEVSELVRQRVTGIKNAGQLLYVLDVVDKYQAVDRFSELLKCVNRYAYLEKEAYVCLLAASQREIELSIDIYGYIANILRIPTCPADVYTAVQRVSRCSNIKEQDALCLYFLHDIFCKALSSTDSRLEMRQFNAAGEISYGFKSTERQGISYFFNTEAQLDDLQRIVRYIIALFPQVRRPNCMNASKTSTGYLIAGLRAAMLRFQGGRAYKQLLSHLFTKLEQGESILYYLPADVLAELKLCAVVYEFQSELFEYVCDKPIVYYRRMQAFNGLLPLYFRQSGNAAFSVFSSRDYSAVIDTLSQCATLADSFDQAELVQCIYNDLSKMRSGNFYFPQNYLHTVDELYIYLLNLYNVSKENRVFRVIYALPANFTDADDLLGTYIRHYQRLLAEEKLEYEQRQRAQRIIIILQENRQLLAQINTANIFSPPENSKIEVLALSNTQPERKGFFQTITRASDVDYPTDAPVLSKFRRRSVSFNACYKLYPYFSHVKSSAEESIVEIPVYGLTVTMNSLYPRKPFKIATSAAATHYPSICPIPARSLSLQRVSSQANSSSVDNLIAKSRLRASPKATGNGITFQIAARLEQLLELYQHPDQKKSGLADTQRRRSHELITILANAIVVGAGRAAFSQKMNMVRRYFILNSARCGRKQLSEGIRLLETIAEECGIHV